MAVVDRVLEILESGKGEYYSGEAIAKELDVSRNAVWKSINTLKDRGYKIESRENKGYSLSKDNDILSRSLINRQLAGRSEHFCIEIHDEVDSTNNIAKRLAEEGCAPYNVVIANKQTDGRGRNNRVFYSPKDAGVYFSVVLRPARGINPGDITCMTAVAVARAIEDVVHIEPSIKWVNDIYVDDRKVCGILTEGAYSFEDERLQYAVVGIGINVHEPEGGFAKEIENIATFLTDDGAIKNELVGTILAYMYDYIEDYDASTILREYRERMRHIGRCVDVIMPDSTYEAEVIGVDDAFGLVVRDESGAEHTLRYGEISLRIKE